MPDCPRPPSDKSWARTEDGQAWTLAPRADRCGRGGMVEARGSWNGVHHGPRGDEVHTPSICGRGSPAGSSSRQRRASVLTRLGLTYERSSLARHGLEAFCGRPGGLWASQRCVRVRARAASTSTAAHEPSPQASGRVCAHAARGGASHDWEGTN